MRHCQSECLCRRRRLHQMSSKSHRMAIIAVVKFAPTKAGARIPPESNSTRLNTPPNRFQKIYPSIGLPKQIEGYPAQNPARNRHIAQPPGRRTATRLKSHYIQISIVIDVVDRRYIRSGHGKIIVLTGRFIGVKNIRRHASGTRSAG